MSDLRKDLWRKPETENGQIIGGCLQGLAVLLFLASFLVLLVYAALSLAESIIYASAFQREFLGIAAGISGFGCALCVILWRFSVWFQEDAQ